MLWVLYPLNHTCFSFLRNRAASSWGSKINTALRALFQYPPPVEGHIIIYKSSENHQAVSWNLIADGSTGCPGAVSIRQPSSTFSPQHILNAGRRYPYKPLGASPDNGDSPRMTQDVWPMARAFSSGLDRFLLPTHGCREYHQILPFCGVCLYAISITLEVSQINRYRVPSLKTDGMPAALWPWYYGTPGAKCMSLSGHSNTATLPVPGIISNLVTVSVHSGLFPVRYYNLNRSAYGLAQLWSQFLQVLPSIQHHFYWTWENKIQAYSSVRPASKESWPENSTHHIIPS